MPTLTEAQLRAAKPREKLYKVYHARGLYLHIKPNDGRFWRFKYRFNGKEKLLSFGTYPYVSLKRARDRREEARRFLEEGKDPSAQRQDQKTRATALRSNWLRRNGSRYNGIASRRRGEFTQVAERTLKGWLARLCEN